MSKPCPYCGEMIADSAKKCRFCGEWLEAKPVGEAVPVEEVPAPAAEAIAPGDIPVEQEGQLPAPPPAPNAVAPQAAAAATAAAAAAQPQPTVIVQNKIINQTQVINNVPEEEETSSGPSYWLWIEMVIVAAVVWYAYTWWAGLLTFAGLAILLSIPVIGHLVCIILGVGVGLVVGAVAVYAEFPTWLCWTCGIIAAIAVSGVNLMDRSDTLKD